MTLFNDVYDTIMSADEYLWNIVLIILVCFGLYATVRFKGLQVTRVGHAINLTLKDIKDKEPKNNVSSFEAFCISMGARIGVGNIVGTAAAIVTGGPGAIFWMWVFATIGAASSFVETIIGQL
ncbi:MAG: alanine:cation symporter family protein, partial [archaeon]|nr:alanine:cation symporter family protein [archaeon]